MKLEIAQAIQKVCTGETVELRIGDVAEHAVEFKNMAEKMSPEKAARCKEYFDKMVADDTVKTYDADSLMDEIDELNKQFKNFVYNEDSSDQFLKMVDSIEELLMNSPLVGMDSVPYGIAEVCIFSELEYFVSRKFGIDSEIHKKQYRQNLVNMTEGEPVADYWMNVYEELQKRYDTLVTDIEDENEFMYSVIACALLALSAMKDHDTYMMDMVTGGAPNKAKEITEELISGDYDDGFSDSVDNAVAMYKFIAGYFIED